MKRELKFSRLAFGGMVCSLMLAAGSLTFVAPVQAQPSAAASQSSEPYKPRGGLRLTLGDFEVLALIDGEFSSPPMFAPKRPPEEMERHRHLLTPTGNTQGAVGGYLIRNKTNKRLVIVELGLGNYQMPGMPKPQATMLKELAAFGYKPEDITDIIFTHLHLDHVGWASVDGKPTFPNAAYRCHQAEWDHWVKHTPEYKDPSEAWFVKTGAEAVKPIEPLLKTYTGESFTVYPGLTMRAAMGHTPGHTIVQLESNGKRALLIGDLVHNPAELEDKTWPGMFDTDGAKATAARSAIIDEVVSGNIPVAAAHFGGMRFGNVVMTTTRGLQFYFNESEAGTPMDTKNITRGYKHEE